METQDQRRAGENLPKSVSCSAPAADEPERRLAAGFAGNEHPKPVTDRRSIQPKIHVPADPLLRARLDAIYTPLETAVTELQNRRRHFDGRTPGRDWLPLGFPAERAGAFLFRFIATPNFETRRFLELAGGCGLLPVIGEYHRDRYASCNPIKRALVKLGFARRELTEDNTIPLVEHFRIVGKNPNSPLLCEMQTKWKQSLVAFHHEMVTNTLNGGGHPLLAEYSQHYADAGARPAVYYAELLRVAIADGILFEDFLLDETELPFTRDVVLPAFDAVTAAHGLKPLIVRLTSPEEEASPHWYWYPVELKAFVQERMSSRTGNTG